MNSNDENSVIKSYLTTAPPNLKKGDKIRLQNRVTDMETHGEIRIPEVSVKRNKMGWSLHDFFEFELKMRLGSSKGYTYYARKLESGVYHIKWKSPIYEPTKYEISFLIEQGYNVPARFIKKETLLRTLQKTTIELDKISTEMADTIAKLKTTRDQQEINECIKKLDGLELKLRANSDLLKNKKNKD